MPSGLVRRIRDRDLATIQTWIASSAPGQTVSKDALVTLAAPATITERYTPGRNHFPILLLHPAGASSPFDINGVIRSAPVSYERGETVTERWNVGVFGPSFYDRALVAREGNLLGFDLYLFGDQGAGHYGESEYDSFDVTLSRDGALLGSWTEPFGAITVPAGRGSYRLAATATRSVSQLSTRISTEWTFTSAETEQLRPLPAMAIRFAPDLDNRNRARAGMPFAIPVQVQRLAGAEFGQPTNVRVEVSYDDGDHWRAVPLRGTGLDRTAQLVHPRQGEFVSLRATAADSLGNTVEQTIIHAYALK